MRKAILMMLLAAVSGSAAAEWVQVGSSQVGGYDIYVDPATIRKSGDMAKMWTLNNYKTAQSSTGKLVLSRSSQFEFDCKNERSRMLFFSEHSGNMSEGAVVYTSASIPAGGYAGIPSAWIPLPPGSVNEILWKLACAKK